MIPRRMEAPGIKGKLYGNINKIFKREHSYSDFLYFKLIAMVPFLIAIVSIAQHSWIWTVIYLGWIVIHVLVIYRLLCTHCPHYAAREGKTCCHFIWSMPGVFARQPRSIGPGSKVGIAFMIVISSLFPFFWLVQDLILMVLYIMSLAVLFTTMIKYECVRCSNLHCPKNQTE